MENPNPVVKFDGERVFTFRAIYPGAKPLPYASLTVTDNYQVEQKSLVEKYQNDALDAYIAKVKVALVKKIRVEKWFFRAVEIARRFWDKRGR